MDDLALLDDEMMQKLLDDGWEHGRVPKLEEVGGKRLQAPVVGGILNSSVLLPIIGFLAGGATMALLLLAPRRY